MEAGTDEGREMEMEADKEVAIDAELDESTEVGIEVLMEVRTDVGIEIVEIGIEADAEVSDVGSRVELKVEAKSELNVSEVSDEV